MVLDCAERIKGISVVNNLISCWASYVCIGSEEHSVSCKILKHTVPLTFDRNWASSFLVVHSSYSTIATTMRNRITIGRYSSANCWRGNRSLILRFVVQFWIQHLTNFIGCRLRHWLRMVANSGAPFFVLSIYTSVVSENGQSTSPFRFPRAWYNITQFLWEAVWTRIHRLAIHFDQR